MDERITALCSSLGQMTQRGYIPSDDCKINVDELAYSIWNEDSTLKNVSALVYQLGVFEKDFVPLFLYIDEMSFVALKALTASTFPVKSDNENLAYFNEILHHYKTILVKNKDIFIKVLSFTADVIQNPSTDQEKLNQAELALTFIRNVTVIPSNMNEHRLFIDILYDASLFEVVEELKLKRFGNREIKFSIILSGIFSGLFAPFLPLLDRLAFSDFDTESSFSPSLINHATNRKKNVSTRHGHWAGSVTVRNKAASYVYTGPITSEMLQINPLPSNLIRPKTRPRRIGCMKHSNELSPREQEAASKVFKSKSFLIIYNSLIPSSFSIYERNLSVTDQIRVLDLTTFFLEFSVKYGLELTISSFNDSRMVKYFLTMATFWKENRLPQIEGFTAELCYNKLCNLFSAISTYFCHIIQQGEDKEIVNSAKSIIYENSKGIEDFLILILAEKTKSQTPISMIQDAIISLENFYRLYEISEKHSINQRKITRRNREDSSIEYEQQIESFKKVNALNIVNRLTYRKSVLIPYFLCLSNYSELRDSALQSIYLMLERFLKSDVGIASLLKLTYLNIISKLLLDEFFKKNEYARIRDTLQEIVHKLIYNIKKDRTILLCLLVGPEQYDLHNEDDDKAAEDKIISESLGITKEVSDILSKPLNIITGSDEDKIIVDKASIAQSIEKLFNEKSSETESSSTDEGMQMTILNKKEGKNESSGSELESSG